MRENQKLLRISYFLLGMKGMKGMKEKS